MNLRRYRRRPNQIVAAVQLKLETAGFEYTKWGSGQRCKRDDFIVDNAGDVYTVDAQVFARTYRQVSPGQYVKTTPVWAAKADHPGSVTTKEGSTNYDAGDYVVSNDEQGADSWAVGREKFEHMYELDN